MRIQGDNFISDEISDEMSCVQINLTDGKELLPSLTKQLVSRNYHFVKMIKVT